MKLRECHGIDMPRERLTRDFHYSSSYGLFRVLLRSLCLTFFVRMHLPGQLGPCEQQAIGIREGSISAGEPLLPHIACGSPIVTRRLFVSESLKEAASRLSNDLENDAALWRIQVRNPR